VGHPFSFKFDLILIAQPWLKHHGGDENTVIILQIHRNSKIGDRCINTASVVNSWALSLGSYRNVVTILKLAGRALSRASQLCLLAKWVGTSGYKYRDSLNCLLEYEKTASDLAKQIQYAGQRGGSSAD
jgi:hypothetical protein